MQSTEPSRRFRADRWLPRLLLVDDSATRRKSLSQQFSLRGYPVSEAESGTEAWDLLEAGLAVPKFDLVVTDLNMPGLSGQELRDRIRQASALEGLPVILYSADRYEGVRTHAHARARAADFLKGAVDFDKVVSNVEFHVHTRRMQMRLEEVRTMMGGEA